MLDTPSTPSRPRCSHPLDDFNDTPSKRMRVAFSNLSGTESGSFLTSKSPYTADKPFPRLLEKTSVDIPQPDWSLIRSSSDPDQYSGKEAMGRQIDELTKALQQAQDRTQLLEKNQEVWAAQAVLQDMTLLKMNRVVYEREEEKKNKKSGLMLPNPGYGRIWTDDSVAQKLRETREERARKQAEKEANVMRKDQLKEKRKEMERRWKETIDNHRKEVEAHKEKCAQLRAAGTRIKDLPPKPKHISKKDLSAQIIGRGTPEVEKELEGEGEGEQSDNEGEEGSVGSGYEDD
ncbi:hypothetical protein F5880DRAFT_1477183 [Lentinula raphanica]|nr:hypothetical protein F5880DRAFT_1477183 [Lentinula raphanica]